MPSEYRQIAYRVAINGNDNQYANKSANAKKWFKIIY